MSTIDTARAEAEPSSPDDPFRYGWRTVIRRQPNGRLAREQIPLPLEGLLFPEEGDHAVQHHAHVEDCLFLLMIFGARLAGDPGALVLSDCRVDYNIPGVRPLGPDIAVFLGAPEGWDGATFRIAENSAAPVLVVEVTSPDTRNNDFGIKKELYHRAGVPLYVIVDARPDLEGRRVKLHGFRHAAEGYEPAPLDDRDRLWVGPLNLWLAVIDARVACIDGETGEVFGGYYEQVQARIEAEARSAEAEARSAEAEARNLDLEARVLEMEAELRRLRGEG